MTDTAGGWPITLADVRAAERRIRPLLVPTPFRRYPTLDAALGAGIEVWVKHENFQPTNSFKVRNGLALVTALRPDERARGVVAATRGNHGLGLAYAGALLRCPVTVCVPVGNNPEKNAAMVALGAHLVEQGRDYDEALQVAHRLVAQDGQRLAHSTNDCQVIAGAGTLGLEMLEEQPQLEALVMAVGGGSQAVGTLTVARELRPDLCVWGVQAAGAAAIHDSWHAGRAITRDAAVTFADGLATRTPYAFTFPALREGLAGFVAVGDAQIADAIRLLLRTTHSLVEGAGAAGLAGLLALREGLAGFVAVGDAQIADAIRLLLRTTHSLVEGAGAAGLAGLLALRDTLAGRRVGVVLSGGNIDAETLRRVVTGAL
jgi:threonine dehydratase